MLGSRSFVAPRKAAIPPSPTPQQKAAVPHSTRSSSNNTQDTHPCTVLSRYRPKDSNSANSPVLKVSLSGCCAAPCVEGIASSPGVLFVLPCAVSTDRGTSSPFSRGNSAPLVREMPPVSSADVVSASLFEGVRLLSEFTVLSEF
ncbi:exo-alpha-sialidase [Trypanosoma cruzi]|nr:exo-alpha-sialidase [Trypanosoma cruzi]